MKQSRDGAYFGFGKYNDSFNNAMYIGMNKNDNNQDIYRVYRRTTGSSVGTNYNTNTDRTVYQTIKIQRIGSTINLYVNDNLLHTDSSPYSDITNFQFKGNVWMTGLTLYVRNLSLKPL